MKIFREYAHPFGDVSISTDLAMIDEPLVMTAEFKSSGPGIAADVWVTAPIDSETLAVVLRYQGPLTADMNVEAAYESLEALYREFLKPQAMRSRTLGGVQTAIYPPDPETRRRLSWLHLQLHEAATNIPFKGQPVAVRTAMEYKLIKSFEYRDAAPMIAKFEEIGLPAANKRLHLARQAGLIRKMSEGRATNRDSK